MTATLAQGLYILSPPISGFHVSPASVHFYGLMCVIGAIDRGGITWFAISRRKGKAAAEAAIIGARIVFR